MSTCQQIMLFALRARPGEGKGSLQSHLSAIKFKRISNIMENTARGVDLNVGSLGTIELPELKWWFGMQDSMSAWHLVSCFILKVQYVVLGKDFILFSFIYFFTFFVCLNKWNKKIYICFHDWTSWINKLTLKDNMISYSFTLFIFGPATFQTVFGGPYFPLYPCMGENKYFKYFYLMNNVNIKTPSFNFLSTTT